MIRRHRRALLATAVVVYLVVGFFCSRAFVSWGDEQAYLAFGYLALKGKVSLFQDEMTGQRVPLPFYVLGVSQLIVGPNLWAARLVSLLLGLGVLGLTVSVARHLHDEVAGVLAGLLFATQGALVGYYATAMYHALTALLLMGAVWLLIGEGKRWQPAAAMAIAALLFLTRTNMMPAILFFLLWALWRARTTGARLMILGIAATPPALFFLSDPGHLKLLAYFPILHRLVEPLGYRSLFALQGYEPSSLGNQVWALALFARRYESWAVALGGLGLSAAIALVQGRPLGWPAERRATAVVSGLFVWILGWHFVLLRLNWKWAAAYFPTFAPLAAVLLAVAAASLLAREDFPGSARAVLGLALLVSLTISVVFIRNPLLPLPLPVPFRGDPVQLIDRSAAHLRRLVPTDARVFLVGLSTPVYLAGLRAYVPQMESTGTLAPIDQDPALVARNGLWGRLEVERWLGLEAEWALISPDVLLSLERERPEQVRRIRELLHQRFTFVERVDEAPWSIYEVYRRR
jgi:hypothetical protein